MNTPCFVISKEKLDSNINDFQQALKEYWPNSKIGYSVKTNSLPWLLSYLKKKGVFAEVVSDEEFRLAELCGYNAESIVFNGPIKGEEVFKKACGEGTIINIDSKNDLTLLKKYGSANTNVGIRINLPPTIFDEKDIGYEEDGFRFGFCEENNEFQKALSIVYDVCGKKEIGLHLHCNSVTRSPNVYIAVAQYAVNLIKKYDLSISFIDMGGGYFGGVPGKTTPMEYICAIKNVLIEAVDPLSTVLVVEPGSAIIGSVIDLHTTVLDVKDTLRSRIVTTDGSRIHIDPLWKKSAYMYSIDTSSKERSEKSQLICGYTCMDHDRLMKIENAPILRIGDKIIYHRVGAYSVTFGGMFINYHPDVYVQSENGIEKVRSKTSVSDYYRIHS